MLGAGIAFGLFACAENAAQGGVITASILSVNLTNPVTTMGNGLSQITFSLFSPGIGREANLGTSPADISVSSSPGVDRYAGIGGTQAGLNVSFVGRDVVNVTLTPLRVYRPGENARFTLTVRGRNTVRIVSAMGGMPPMWFDNSSPPVKLRPGPTLPGFTVNTRDADYTAYNDLDTAFGIQNLQYFPDITQSVFDSLDLDAVLAESPGPPVIPLPSGGFFGQPGLPDPRPGNLFAATGQLLDPTDTMVVGSFKEAVVTGPVPEPASITLALLGLATSAAFKFRRIFTSSS